MVKYARGVQLFVKIINYPPLSTFRKGGAKTVYKFDSYFIMVVVLLKCFVLKRLN